ncbi:hypothetical protein Tco_0935122 [Tanacetum coccineum]
MGDPVLSVTQGTAFSIRNEGFAYKAFKPSSLDSDWVEGYIPNLQPSCGSLRELLRICGCMASTAAMNGPPLR